MSQLALKYNPKLIDRYPIKDYKDMPFPAITNFAFPTGVEVTKVHYQPTVFHFAMTADSGLRTFGICLNFSEKIEKGVKSKLHIKLKPSETLYS